MTDFPSFCIYFDPFKSQIENTKKRNYRQIQRLVSESEITTEKISKYPIMEAEPNVVMRLLDSDLYRRIWMVNLLQTLRGNALLILSV